MDLLKINHAVKQHILNLLGAEYAVSGILSDTLNERFL